MIKTAMWNGRVCFPAPVAWATAIVFLALAPSRGISDHYKEEARALPVIKAFSYAVAIDEFCFADRAFLSDTLKAAAFRQVELVGSDFSELTIATAGRHLMGDNSACRPAMDFVERTVATLPALEDTLAKLAKVRDEELATKRAKALEVHHRRAQEEAATKAAAAEAAAKRDIELCEIAIKEVNARIDARQTFMANLPTRLEECRLKGPGDLSIQAANTLERLKDVMAADGSIELPFSAPLPSTAPRESSPSIDSTAPAAFEDLIGSISGN
jgi:hypothetical protein